MRSSGLLRLMVTVLAIFAATCAGGSGKGDPSDMPLPTGPTNSGTPTATGDPSNADFIELGAQLTTMAVDQIVQALSGSGASSLAVSEPFALRRPSQNTTRTAAYFCCGPATNNPSYITMTTTITVPPGTGSLGIVQTLGALTEPEWSSTVANNWRIDLSDLRITSELATTGSTVNESQQLRLSGTLWYRMPNATEKSVTVDVRFQYADLVSSVPTATGQIGTATLSGETTRTLTSPGRCSRPREGCGPMVSGDAPCTIWPRCPGT